MSGIALLIFLFFCLFIFCGFALYLVLGIPAKRRALRARLTAVSARHVDAGDTLELVKTKGEGDLFDRINDIFLSTEPGYRVQLFLSQAGSDLSTFHLVGISLILGSLTLLFTFALSFPWMLSMAAVGLAMGAAPFYFAYKRHKRLLSFEQQFPEAMDVLARAVRAGYAFTSGLKLIAEELPDPVAIEFKRTFDLQNLGMPLKDALYDLSERMPLPDVRIFVSTLQIQSEAGGNLAEVLDNLARIVRERFRLLRQVRVFSAEGRLSLYALTAMPPLICTVLFIMNPGYIMRLFVDPDGQQILALSVVLQIIGFFIIRKMINIKV